MIGLVCVFVCAVLANKVISNIKQKPEREWQKTMASETMVQRTNFIPLNLLLSFSIYL